MEVPHLALFCWQSFPNILSGKMLKRFIQDAYAHFGKATLVDVNSFYFLSSAAYARVLPNNYTEEGEKYKIRVYDLKVLKVYKGSDLVINLTDSIQVNASGDIALLVKAYVNAVKLENGTEYLLAGIIRNGRMELNVGSWVEKWSEVTPAYQTGISDVYAQNCECHITPCFGAPCKPLKGCDVHVRQLRQFYQGCEWRHSYCVKKEDATACSWHETAEYINCTNQIP